MLSGIVLNKSASYKLSISLKDIIAPALFEIGSFSGFEEALKTNDISIQGPYGATVPTGATLTLADTLTIKVFAAGDVSYAYYLTNEDAEIELDVFRSGEESYVMIENILPTLLGTDTEIFFELDGATSSIKLSAYDCAALVCRDSEQLEEFKQLALALYVYGEAALAYAN